MKKKVFLYVGHSNWGKSAALKVITHGNWQTQIIELQGYSLKVKKVSNDDIGSKLFKYAKLISSMKYQYFVLAFCPRVVEGNRHSQIAIDILAELQKDFELFFFVQEERFNHPNHQISTEEINVLRSFGTVDILQGQNDATARGRKFTEFIIANLPAKNQFQRSLPERG